MAILSLFIDLWEIGPQYRWIEVWRSFLFYVSSHIHTYEVQGAYKRIPQTWRSTNAKLEVKEVKTLLEKWNHFKVYKVLNVQFDHHANNIQSIGE